MQELSGRGSMLVLLAAEALVSVCVLVAGIQEAWRVRSLLNVYLCVGFIMCLGSALLAVGYINTIAYVPPIILAVGMIMWEMYLLRLGYTHFVEDYSGIVYLCGLIIAPGPGFLIWIYYMVTYTPVIVFLCAWDSYILRCLY